MAHKGQNNALETRGSDRYGTGVPDSVLEKVLFSNVFERDIRRLYFYKKADRLVRAIAMVAPAFDGASKQRIEEASLRVVEGTVRATGIDFRSIAQDLLVVTSILSAAALRRTLSRMNAELISAEAQSLLADLALYEEPLLTLEEPPTISSVARTHQGHDQGRSVGRARQESEGEGVSQSKGHIGQPAADSSGRAERSATPSARREAILSALRTNGPSYIKDIALAVPEVSEKTVQRELGALVGEGVIVRKGDRRWTTYELAEASA